MLVRSDPQVEEEDSVCLEFSYCPHSMLLTGSGCEEFVSAGEFQQPSQIQSSTYLRGLASYVRPADVTEACRNQRKCYTIPCLTSGRVGDNKVINIVR